MLFKSTLIFVAAIALVAEAHQSSGHDDDCKGDKGKGGVATGVGIVPLKVGLPAANNKPVGFGKLGIDLDDDKCGEKLENLHFDKEKFKAFLHKVRNLFRVYASKELVPEVKELIAKTASFVIETVAKQKPEEMAKINSIIQKSAKVCDNACKEGEGKTKSKC